MGTHLSVRPLLVHPFVVAHPRRLRRGKAEREPLIMVAEDTHDLSRYEKVEALCGKRSHPHGVSGVDDEIDAATVDLAQRS
jgi:hypothetical protein